MAHGIRALAAAAALLIVLTACASAATGGGGESTATGGGGGSSASCAATLSFGGEMYYGTSLRTHPPYTWVARISAAHMHEIGSGEFPPCRDTNHSTDDQGQSVQVARIDGVDTGTAVAVLPHGDVFVKRLSLPLIQAVLKSAHGIRWDYSS
jgi:hypothetical protein